MVPEKYILKLQQDPGSSKIRARTEKQVIASPRRNHLTTTNRSEPLTARWRNYSIIITPKTQNSQVRFFIPRLDLLTI